MSEIRIDTQPIAAGIAHLLSGMAMFTLASGTCAALIAITTVLALAWDLEVKENFSPWMGWLLRVEYLALLAIPLPQWQHRWRYLSSTLPIDSQLVASCLYRGALTYTLVAIPISAAWLLSLHILGGMTWWCLAFQLGAYLLGTKVLGEITQYERLAPAPGQGTAVLTMQEAQTHVSETGEHNPWR